jgi:2-oxoglutarate dehydrogenase E1 component
MLKNVNNPFAVDWTGLHEEDWQAPVDTSVPLETIQLLSEQMLALPEAFELNARVAKIMDDRRKMAAGALALDWGFAENMAYATLLKQGFKVRVSGQDSGRGTFFHRHAVLHNQKDGNVHVPLMNLPDVPSGAFMVIDSILSEEAILGFEYGFSTAEPDCLTIWEAQFGDFTNGAQVVIDQFLSSGEAKWGRLTGLTLLLPHGYEGQGPEHSSARPERFLQLCAEHNMQVCMPSTPAQAFHMLRRQMLRNFRKPLIVMSPKSLLRHKLAINSLEDLYQGEFQTIISEIDGLEPEKIRRVVFCSGKVYYDLLETRRERGMSDTAIVRIEQLYPFPYQRYEEELARYPKAKDLVWCQEEPRNQGAWYQIRHRLQEPLGAKQEMLRYAGRPASASPAVGYYGGHVEQQKVLVEDALDL